LAEKLNIRNNINLYTYFLRLLKIDITNFRSWMYSIVTIYKEEGVFGFFSGLVPKLICDIAGLILASTTTYYVNKYIIQEPEVKRIFATFAQVYLV